MCDTGNIMAQQMDDQISAGINERDECYARIDELEKQNKELIEGIEEFKKNINWQIEYHRKMEIIGKENEDYVSAIHHEKHGGAWNIVKIRWDNLL